MKDNFRGWTSVYGFTFRQSAKGAGFKVVTILITILIIGSIGMAEFITAKPDKKEKAEISPVKTVYILDNSGLGATDFKAVNPELQKKQYQKIAYVEATGQSREETIKKAADDSKQSIAVIITKNEKGYELEAVIPNRSTITKGQADKLVGCMAKGFEASKLMQSGLTAQQLTTVLAPDVTSYSNIGENNSGAVFAIKMAAPMLFSLMLYMMLIFYGQTISKSVSTEKTSKLMETLLTSIHPYALIAGKILAVTTMALLQFVTWIVAAFVGLYGGNAITHVFYPDYKNIVITVIDFLKDNIGESALSLPAIILAIIFFFVGLLFYFIIAGVAGCMVSKPEDVATTQSLFVFPILISWLVVYMAPITGNYSMLNVARYIPFTAPFCVPSDLITGTVGLGQGLLMLLVLTAFSFLFILLSGRLYKGLILYSGQKVNLKMIGSILRNNTN